MDGNPKTKKKLTRSLKVDHYLVSRNCLKTEATAKAMPAIGQIK